ncbi:MAG: DUF192 domain-containing protein, partial [bacterium]|nr:DUF192 domain-containing protein [bacterium]
KENEGMLFVFNTPGIYPFWMKEMNFDIDIIWISEERVVIGIERSVFPESYPEAVVPPAPIMYVLELPSDSAQRNGVDIGESVYFGT